MKRHELWNDRAEKLMEKTFEKFGYGKKKEPVKEKKKEEIKESLEVQSTAAVQENSLLDMDDYNMLAQAVEGPVEKLLADGYTKEDLVDAFKASLGMDQSEIDSGGVSQKVYTMVDELKNNIEVASMDEELRELISNALAKILDTMDANVDTMSEEEDAGPSDVERLAMRIDVLKKRIENKDGITGEDVVEELDIISTMLKGSDEIKEEETESPEVERAEDAARKAKIKALQVQLKALQKTQSME